MKRHLAEIESEDRSRGAVRVLKSYFETRLEIHRIRTEFYNVEFALSFIDKYSYRLGVGGEGVRGRSPSGLASFHYYLT